MTLTRFPLAALASTLRRALLAIVPAIALLTALPTHAAPPADPTTDAEKAAAVRALIGSDGPQPDLKGYGQVALAPWPHAPAGAGELWVVAALLPPADGNGLPEVWTGVLSRSGQDFRLLAGSEHGSIDDIGIALMFGPTVQLDLIPYRYAPDEVGFGVRVSGDYNSSAHADAYEGVKLYRFAAGRLTPVFDALTSMSTLDKSDADACEQAHRPGVDCDAASTVDSEYVLAFSPTATRGHYDLLVRTRPAKGKPARLVKRAVWNGTSYAPRAFDGG